MKTTRITILRTAEGNYELTIILAALRCGGARIGKLEGDTFAEWLDQS